MALCAVQSGFLFWKKPCGEIALGHCGRTVCKKHFLPQPDGPFLCPDCAPQEEDSDSGSWFSWSSSTAAVAGAAAAAGESGAAEPSASDSGGSDSGGSDSGGGGDSGGGDSGSSSD